MQSLTKGEIDLLLTTVFAARLVSIMQECSKHKSDTETESSDETHNIDNYLNPQLFPAMADDIYNHLRASEARKRPLIDYMERIQNDIDASMRATVVDWLVEVAEYYRLVPETVYLAVNYFDRYLSGNAINKDRLQLLGVSCMMIASKYEEIDGCAPEVEDFCYITDNTYSKEEVLRMESAVLNYLKFELTVPTIKCFLRIFLHSARGVNKVQALKLRCLSNYIAELSLLDYTMLRYAPSLVAASAIFLAKYIFLPCWRPWHSTLEHITLYQSSDLRECVNSLHTLYCNSQTSSSSAIWKKYSTLKYVFAAKKYCPSSIAAEFFQNISKQ